jgi:hypothetical protein
MRLSEVLSYVSLEFREETNFNYLESDGFAKISLLS